MFKTEIKLVPCAVMAGLLVGMAACTIAEDQQSSESLPVESEQVTAPKPKIVEMPMNLNGQIAVAKKDLAQRLDVPPESVVLSGAQQVTWRSGALGCPEPGMNYTEALVPGSVIYLQVDNVIHVYHAKFAGTPFYCPRERVEPPAPEGDGDLT